MSIAPLEVLTVDEGQFLATKERIDKFNVGQIHTAAEWQVFIDDGINLLNHPDETMKDFAIERMQKAVAAENRQHYRQHEFKAASALERLHPILYAIAKQAALSERCLLNFTRWCLFSGEQNVILTNWLNSPAASDIFTIDTISAAKIQARLYPKDDWDQAKIFLEPFFSHSNDLLRAASAAALGDMYSCGAEHLPAFDEMMRQVQEREIERPGFAGAFLGLLSIDSAEDGSIEGSDINLNDWILEIIVKRKTDEPYVPLYNGIDFHAHEILSGNPEAVRKLIDFGAEDVAAMTATEEERPIVGMQVLLEELANSSDVFVSRICCWHLAYYYRALHPEAVRRGYVELAERDDVDVFLVFDPESDCSRPYAATIYPRDSFLSEDIARKWSEKLNPPALRPPMEGNSYPFKTPLIEKDQTDYQFGPFWLTFQGDNSKKQWDRVWVKWPLPSSDW
jgi:hypothetical protein